jgi:hypothetical protein
MDALTLNITYRKEHTPSLDLPYGTKVVCIALRVLEVLALSLLIYCKPLFGIAALAAALYLDKPVTNIVLNILDPRPVITDKDQDDTFRAIRQAFDQYARPASTIVTDCTAIDFLQVSVKDPVVVFGKDKAGHVFFILKTHFIFRSQTIVSGDPIVKGYSYDLIYKQGDRWLYRSPLPAFFHNRELRPVDLQRFSSLGQLKAVPIDEDKGTKDGSLTQVVYHLKSILRYSDTDGAVLVAIS